MFDAVWTGHYPALCQGEWKIYKNGIDISHKIPEDRRNSPMDTLKVYRMWYFDESWEEHWRETLEGLNVFDWYQENKEWVDKLCFTYDEVRDLYFAIQSEDWRYGSCGGCI